MKKFTTSGLPKGVVLRESENQSRFEGHILCVAYNGRKRDTRFDGDYLKTELREIGASSITEVVSSTTREGKSFFLIDGITSLTRLKYFIIMHEVRSIMTEVFEGYHVQSSRKSLFNAVSEMMKNEKQFVAEMTIDEENRAAWIRFERPSPEQMTLLHIGKS